MRIARLPFLLAGLALLLVASCMTPRTSDDGTAVEASAPNAAADFTPLHGWPESN